MKQEIKERIEQINNGIVPAGYKKTPVGVCPIEWEVDIYKNLGEFSKGKGIPGYTILDNGVPCVGYGDIYTKYNIKFEVTKCYTDKMTANDSKKISKNTLLFTGSGETAEEIGKCVCYCGEEDIYAGGDIILFNSYNVNPLFLSYQQNLWSFIKEKARLGQGHSVVHIYPDDISKLHSIFSKTKTEQEKIAEILDCATKQVELQEQLVDKLKSQKKALMQKLLTPQPDWQEVKLGDICVFKNKTTHQSNEGLINGLYPFYTNNIDLKTKYFNNYDFDGEYIIANTGGQAYFSYVNKKFAVMSDCLVFSIKNYDALFIYYFLMQHLGYINKLGFTGSGLKHLDKSWFKRFVIKYPITKVQEKISVILNNIDKQIELQQRLLEQYKLRQKALMQLLLTGIVRVNKRGGVTNGS